MKVRLADGRELEVVSCEWMAAWTGAKADLRPGEGHGSLAFSSYDEILDGLLESASLQ